MIAHPEIKLTKDQQKKYEKYLKRLQNGEPLAYILGRKEFFGLDFEINKHTLIPRPETEILVEDALNHIANSERSNCLVADVGTGSGCIIISIVAELFPKPSFDFLAMDISKKALSIAEKNAKKHGVEKNIRFIRSNLLNFLLKEKSNIAIKKYDNIAILANLPYLSEKIYSKTKKSVKDFEPKSALFSGKDGLDHYRNLFSQIKKLKQKNPSAKWTVIFEISPEQKKIIEKEFPNKFNIANFSFTKDLAGKWRIGTATIYYQEILPAM